MTTDLILKNYQDYLEYLAKEKSDEIFTNAGKAHASILMSILLKYTRNEVRIFCEGFKPDLVTTEPYWSELNRFLEKRENKISVLVESSDYLNDNPLLLLRNKKTERNNDSIKVRLIQEEDKKHIFESLNTKHCNFAVFDNEKFRLEHIPENYQAIGSFNHPDNCNKLMRLFDASFQNAEDLI